MRKNKIMLNKNILFVTLILLCCLDKSFSQVSVKDSAIFAPLINISYAYQIPSGDMAKRFGANSNIGMSFMIKTKSNWLLGADCSFLFGDLIKEDSILNGISTKEGDIITQNGQVAIVRLYERGYSTQIKAGKLFPVLGPNKNSGLFFTVGAGFLQHKIRIDNVGNTVLNLSDEYKRGYDRLTYGFAASEFIGYTFLGNKRRVNFFAGIEFYQAWTKNRRTYNYDTMQKDDSLKRDYLTGFRVGWIVPLYKKVPKEFYYH